MNTSYNFLSPIKSILEIKKEIKKLTSVPQLVLFILLPLVLILGAGLVAFYIQKGVMADLASFYLLASGFFMALLVWLSFYYLVNFVICIMALIDKVEDNLADGEKLFPILYKLNPSVIIIQDKDGIIGEVRGEYREIFGLEKDKLISHKLLDILGTTVDINYLPFSSPHPIMKPFLTGKSIDKLLIGFLRITDKRPRWLRLSSQPVLNPEKGEVVKVVTILVDTTDTKLTKEKLKARTAELYRTRAREAKEQARYSALLASIGDGLIATDWEGLITFINEESEKMLSLNPGEAIGKFLHELVEVQNDKGASLSPAEQPIQQTLLTGKKFISDRYTFVCRDQTKFSVAITSAPVILEGKSFGTIMIFKDITREKEIDRMKTEFISLASHQLRTPLSAMKWFLEMLLAGDAGKLNEEQRDFIQNINQANERMIDLVNGLLNISRIESGRLIIDPRPTDLSKLVKEVIDELEIKFKEKEQTPIVSIHQKLPKINIDPKLIRHVYMNLLTNAIKYSPKGTEITVFLSRKRDKIISQVSDQGYGIPEKQQHKVFQKFFRAENIVTVETEGTGLGLYVVKAIIESSGGEIWFESKENKGTTFWFCLPLSGSKPHRGEVSLDT